MTAASFCMLSAGLFFLSGLIFGAWKYAAIVRSERAQAPVYVDVAHRAALLYAFACALLSQLCATNAWANRVNLTAAVVLISYFALSVFGYAIHGALRDTDNQLQRPHRLGNKTIPNGAMLSFMVSLVLAEVSAFLVIFSGYVMA